MKNGVWPSVPSKPRKTGTYGTFFGRQPTKILKIATCKFGRNFFHRRKFRKRKFRYFFKNVRYIFSRFKPFSDHSMDITAVSGEKKFRRSLEILHLQVYKKVLGAISRFMRPKMKLFAVKFRRILEVFAWWGLWSKFWAHFHDLCVQKWSCFLRSADTFQRFSPCEVYNKSSVRIITIFASTNEAVCHEVQTDLGRFLRASFITKLWMHFLDFCVQKPSGLLLSSDAFWKFSTWKVHTKYLGAFSRFMCPKMKLFPAKLRRISEVFTLRRI